MAEWCLYPRQKPLGLCCAMKEGISSQPEVRRDEHLMRHFHMCFLSPAPHAGTQNQNTHHREPGWLSLLTTYAQIFCKANRQRPQNQAAKPNWRKSDSTAGGSSWDLSAKEPRQTRSSKSLYQILGGRDHSYKPCS